ncbi:MAG: phytanoyl-CoA dioxygenase family protein [Rhodospirillaceae bacterium]|nr:phytanoyl-CoA dioxygenase family protein [Rhodospirillaceae bacterium]
MFGDGFASIPPREIAAAIRDRGFYFHPAALSAGHVRRILNEIGPDRVTINQDGIATVRYGRQFFLNQVLGRSKAAYDLITSDRMMDLAEAALGPHFRLTAKRYYTTHDGMRMQWHRDNKSAANEVEPRDGIICIFYLTDADEGAFQFVRGSHRFDLDRASPDFAEDDIAARYGDRIETLRGPAGACVMCSLQTIHRAEPIVTDGLGRTSLLFEIGGASASAEAVLVNTSFVDNLDDRRLHYLGFGNRNLKTDFPTTDVSTLDDRASNAALLALEAHRIAIAGRAPPAPGATRGVRGLFRHLRARQP